MTETSKIKIYIKSPSDKLTDDTKDRLSVEVDPDETIANVC